MTRARVFHLTTPTNSREENFHAQFPTIQDDPRVTRVGGTLRKLSLDEIPNLWSVVVGDMSLVGPRPEAPEVLQYYTPEEMTKFTCKPGITGLAQISGRGLLNWGETLALDLQYVRNRSVALDLKIILLDDQARHHPAWRVLRFREAADEPDFNVSSGGVRYCRPAGRAASDFGAQGPDASCRSPDRGWHRNGSLDFWQAGPGLFPYVRWPRKFILVFRRGVRSGADFRHGVRPAR